MTADLLPSRIANLVGGLKAKTKPPIVVAHPHWQDDYRRAAESAGIALTLEEAVTQVNASIAEIDTA